MPKIEPIPAICFAQALGAAGASPADISSLIAPPYDVLDEKDKAKLLAQSAQNIVGIDLPHLPAKTVGPAEVYEQAGARYRDLLARKVLASRGKPAFFVYHQTFTAGGRRHTRRGLIANLPVQPFGPAADGSGGIFPHEQTFSGPKEDRLRLMRATRAQLSPIFGLYSDGQDQVGKLLAQLTAGRAADFGGRTAGDGVEHEVWAVDDEKSVGLLQEALRGRDVFIADGHHRYNTALNYLKEMQGQAGAGTGPSSPGRDSGPALKLPGAFNKEPLADARGSSMPLLPGGLPGGACMFVLVAMEDPGMIVLPTHRVLGGMQAVTAAELGKAAAGKLSLKPFRGRDGKPAPADEKGLGELERALPTAGAHAMGIYLPGEPKGADRLWVATTVDGDPLRGRFPKASEAWRQLDVAILQHLVVEDICGPSFGGAGVEVAWKFPHTLEELGKIADQPGWQIGVIVQPTPLGSVKAVSMAGELMPQKSTFFYPKLATGLVINPLG